MDNKAENIFKTTKEVMRVAGDALSEEEGDPNPFKRSSKLRRTPPAAARKGSAKELQSRNRPGGEEIRITGLQRDSSSTRSAVDKASVLSKEAQQEDGRAQKESGTQKDTPTQKENPTQPKDKESQDVAATPNNAAVWGRAAGIKDEGEMLKRCQAVMRNMKTAMGRQKNISMDVKNGLAELEELLEALILGRQVRQRTKSSPQKPTAVVETSATTPTQKRTASSPLQQAAEIKRKKEQPDGWQEVRPSKSKRKQPAAGTEEAGRVPDQTTTVERVRDANAVGPSKDMAVGTKALAKKKRRRRRTRKSRPEALLIEPAPGKSYAEVLGEIRNRVNPADTGTEVKSIRQTRAGGVLIELGNKTRNKTAFGEAIKSTLGDGASVRNLEPQETVEIRDLDGLTTAEEVTDAVKRELGDLAEHLRVSITGANIRAQKMAVVTLTAKGASQLLKAQHIKIGWVNCRVRQRVAVKRCFRCLGYGHTTATCKGPDRSRICYKCGKEEHVAKQCTAQEHCVLCADAGLDPQRLKHAAGSRKCAIFLEALEKSKSLAK